MKVLGISTSPRQRSNSDLLLREALAGAESARAQVEYLRLGDFDIRPCTECNDCYTTGLCSLDDDYAQVLAKMLDADRLIFATPIFFMAVCAQAKILIDRCQCLWAHKYVLGRPIEWTQGRDRRAMVIAVGGTKSKKMFESVRLTMKYFLNALDMQYAANLFVNNVDEAGAVESNAEAMQQAYRLGGQLAAVDTPLPEKTVDIELTN